MPKHTWKNRDISSVVEKFENIVYDIVKKHCFVEPSNSKREKPKTEKKDVVLERLKHRKKILRKQARRMKKKNQDAGLTLKELYKVIRAHSDYVKLSKKSTEKVEAYKQKEKFFEDPWKFGKQVLDGIQPSGEPEFSKETCEEFFKSKYVDKNRDYEYAPPPGLERPPLPQVIFNLEKPTFNEFWKIVKRKRNSSSPGINGNSYLIYKSSKKIAYLLWELLCFIWEKCEIPKSWILAWIKLLEKKDGCLSPEDMRPISILNVEG